jgi:hypothetical protein
MILPQIHTGCEKKNAFLMYESFKNHKKNKGKQPKSNILQYSLQQNNDIMIKAQERYKRRTAAPALYISIITKKFSHLTSFRRLRAAPSHLAQSSRCCAPLACPAAQSSHRFAAACAARFARFLRFASSATGGAQLRNPFRQPPPPLPFPPQAGSGFRSLQEGGFRRGSLLEGA